MAKTICLQIVDDGCPTDDHIEVTLPMLWQTLVRDWDEYVSRLEVAAQLLLERNKELIPGAEEYSTPGAPF